MIDDIICAPATAPVRSPLAIIRVSGPGCIRLAASLFSRPGDIADRKAVYGSILDEGKIVDDVIFLPYFSPASFTGEDMVEIFCHGNPLITSKIILLLLSRGARAALPGEFSRRAFINGKIDLTGAEAINGVINANSDWEIASAIGQMHGSMKQRVESIKEMLTELKADIESAIDFYEEDIEFISRDNAVKKADEIIFQLTEFLKRCLLGAKISQGVDVTIAGRPNVGKSSLLNAILNRERAIVSNIPGTTRDIISESVHVGGVPVNISDTAGIDDPRDEIERQGIELSRKSIERASVILVVIDGAEGLTSADSKIICELGRREKIFIINKCDIADHDIVSGIEKELGTTAVKVSARKGEGLGELEGAMKEVLSKGIDVNDNFFIADARMRSLAGEAVSSVKRAADLVRTGESAEIIAFELQTAIDQLSDITGEITPDDVLGSIFSRFCIGK